jgi:hypothetical protein
MLYTLTAGDPIASCPGYVVHTGGDYALDQFVPVAMAASPDTEAGAFLCATVVGVDLPSEGVVVEVVPFVMSKRAFRLRFTYAERLRCDAFNASFETNPDLPVELKAAIRTGLADYAAAQDINLADPATQQMLGLYEQLGLLAQGRASEIGALA